jgi:hypothetical protein
VIFVRQRNGECPAGDFYDGLDKKAQAALLAVFHRVAESLAPLRGDKSRPLGEGLFEFKTPGVRMIYFYHGRTVAITNGCVKVKRRKFQNEIRRAKEIRAEYMAQ